MNDQFSDSVQIKLPVVHSANVESDTMEPLQTKHSWNQSRVWKSSHFFSTCIIVNISYVPEFYLFLRKFNEHMKDLLEELFSLQWCSFVSCSPWVEITGSCYQHLGTPSTLRITEQEKRQIKNWNDLNFIYFLMTNWDQQTFDINKI